jgi:hypothetical protein
MGTAGKATWVAAFSIYSADASIGGTMASKLQGLAVLVLEGCGLAAITAVISY